VTFETITRGIPELRAAFEDVHVKVDPVLGRALSRAAIPVKEDVKRRAGPFSERTAAGVRIRRKGTIVRVEQGQRKTTGFHAQYGAYQQRNFFDPALADNEEIVVAASRLAMDEMTARVNELP
jgi:hypothetical protein